MPLLSLVFSALFILFGTVIVQAFRYVRCGFPAWLRRGSPRPPGCLSSFFVKLPFFRFSDSNDERESSPPGKEEAQEKARKVEPSFTKENSRFL